MKIKIKSVTSKKYLYGVFLKNKQATTLVVFLSGLSGGLEFPLLEKASKELTRKNFSTLRLNFCRDTDDKLQRKDVLRPEDMSLSVYVRELKNVLEELGGGNQRIVLVGHSFGAIISLLFLDKYKQYHKKTELVLWDPTLLPWKKRTMEIDFSFNPKSKLYYGKNTKEVMSKKFYKECINTQNTAEILKTLNKRVCIIAAEHGASKDAKKYFSKIKDRKNSKLIIIKKTGHHFAGRTAQKILFGETLKFLDNK